MTILPQISTPEHQEPSVFLSDLSDRDKKFDYFRTAADAIAALFAESEYESYCQRISDCAFLLDFAFDLEGPAGQQKLKLRGARFCRAPRCPICQWRRALMWRAKFFRLLPCLLLDNPKIRFLFLTLTVRNCPLQDLRTTISQMNAAWHRLIKRKDFGAVGFIKSLEITRKPDGCCHPHFHSLLVVPPSYFSHRYVNQREWAQLWKESLRIDYDPRIDIRIIRSKPNCDNPIFAGILETLKYSVKPGDLVGFGNREQDKFWLCEFTKQIYKLKLINTGGIFKKYLQELEEEPEDLIHSGDICDADMQDSVMHIYFKWEPRLKKYVLQT